jgi:hypothetical protein
MIGYDVRVQEEAVQEACRCRMIIRVMENETDFTDLNERMITMSRDFLLSVLIPLQKLKSS